MNAGPQSGPHGDVMRRTLIAAVIIAASVISIAQVDQPNKEQSVYVHDSAVAAEKFALAERMERLKEWNKAADVYQEILEKNSDNVIASPSQSTGGTI